jgi:hypothetical protein
VLLILPELRSNSPNPWRTCLLEGQPFFLSSFGNLMDLLLENLFIPREDVEEFLPF